MPQMTSKRATLILAVIAAAMFTWAATRPWLESSVRFSSVTVLIIPSLAFIVLGGVVGLALTLLENRRDQLIAIGGAWGIFVVFWHPNLWYISALPFFGGLWYQAARMMQTDLRDRHTIRMYPVLRQGIKLILLGVFLMVSLGFYLLPSSQSLTAKTVSHGVQDAVSSAYGNPLVEQQLAQLPPSLRQQFRADVAHTIDTIVQQWFGKLGPFIPPMLALALFLVLWSVAFLYAEVAVWLGVGLFRILKAIGFVSIGEKSVKAEVVIL